MDVFDPHASKGKIHFTDGDLCNFNLGDPDISFQPHADLQWQLGSNLFGPGPSQALVPLSSNGTLCSLALRCSERNQRIECTRCSVNVFHARCTGIGSSTMKTDLEKYSCVFCLSDLAESGRRQAPSLYGILPMCFATQGSEFDYCTISKAH